ncbi:hypothetical protein [Mycobacterium nebraskense]|uniref:Uncharacterized protein n=1 Tax=Mycobacterium nebraskense TaxID=244292 RepID=A0A1X2A215_9MYCO|nr:hypothetical protein [Mycobacterium nebraskense]KKC02341.1 hypothetical protein WU83_24685 [Mycobacterium nebraskense]MBI2695660.1 hypothetical protein [Mycobacterium nebraskense]MCV7120908.1 hypothetical protein [Mycobacterium nebraskense]ORW35139.1 hypothetical protein AWC17_22345 [Mycobacterium nebraskense]
MSRRKALGIAAAAAIALAPFSVVATTIGVAEAAPCAGAGSNPTSCQWCQYLVAQYHTSNVCSQDAPPRRAQPSPTPVQVPELPPYVPPSPVPVQATPLIPPNLPPTNPVATIHPPGPDASRNVSVVAPPRGLDVPPQAVAAAKAAPATRVNPADPPKPPKQVDFNQRVQNVVSAHRENVDVLKVDNQRLVRPRHWEYVDYDDAYRRPALFNPMNQAMTFRYSYNGADREAYLPAGARIVLDAATVGVVPFTAVGDSWVASGSFYGGGSIPPDGFNGPPPPDYKAPAPPKLYQNVLVSVPAVDQTLEVGQVAVVGRDESQPGGSQDTFLLDDSTMAWGQVNDSISSSAQIKVTKTQSLPHAGPTDDGSFLVVLAVRPHEEPTQPAQPWWPSALGYGALGVVVGLTAWALNRKRSDDDVAEPVTTSRSSGN